MRVLRLVVGELNTNCYIVSSQESNAFVIDPGDDAEKIKRFLSGHRLRAKFVINTHGHIDHMRASVGLGLPIYLHEGDVDMVKSPENNAMTSFFGSFDPITPARSLKDGDDVKLDELTFKVIHTPGHTPGGICLFGAGVLFSGDTLFRDGIGRTDFPGASHEVLLTSLRKLSKIDKETVVYPGHGEETTIGRELGRG